MSADLKQTDRTTISRHAERGSYDREAAYAIIDEGMVAHVGFDTGEGVIVIPMTYARIEEEIFLHGAVASRWLSKFDEGAPVSVCITHLDGLVLAKSAFSHSMNYRSVVCFAFAIYFFRSGNPFWSLSGSSGCLHGPNRSFAPRISWPGHTMHIATRYESLNRS